MTQIAPDNPQGTAPASQSVVMERVMPHRAEKIWRALTEGALIAEWLMANDFQPVVGHGFQLRAEPQPHWDGVVDAEVLAVEPPARLAYSWHAAGLKTVVTYELTPTDGGTRVRVEQSGFGPADDKNVQGATYGWRKFLAGLEHTADRL